MQIMEQEEKEWREVVVISQTSTSLWCTGLSGGAPDSVWCPGWPDDELADLKNRRGDVATNHRTVQWCTGLSGESSAPAPKHFGDELVALGKRRKRRV
jgi:adenylylsulfate kinase-like enzyme